LLPLSELFIFGRISEMQARSIIDLCLSTIGKFSQFTSDTPNFYLKTIADNARSRFLQIPPFAKQILGAKPITINGNLIENPEGCLSKCLSDIEGAYHTPTLVHGDFCFSNILYDSRMHRIRLIDPRGADGKGCRTIWGDWKYDYAKLLHSTHGYYDQIIAGRYELKQSGDEYSLKFPDAERWCNTKKYIDEQTRRLCSDHELKTLNSLLVVLFVSMIPLHKDRSDRQKAFAINALRLLTDGILQAPDDL
jgi:hypothetical protein